MFLPLDFTIQEMLTSTYLEIPILNKYRIGHINDTTFGKSSLAIIEQNNRLYGTEILEDRSSRYEVATYDLSGNVNYHPVGTNYGYTIFVNGMYHRYPDSVDAVPDDIALSEYKPQVRITEYFLKLI